ncbi:MAG: response regulator transcription factor [Bacteroidota bacterium]
MRKGIFIVDDHPIMRQGYGLIINRESDLEVAGEASSAEEAMSLLAVTPCDLVIADLSLRGMGGLELIKRIRTQFDDLPILVVSMHDEELYAVRALRAGARGYVMKVHTDVVLIDAIRSMLDGHFYVSETIRDRIVQQFSGQAGLEDSSPLDQLTDRELEVFEHIGQGLTTQEVGQALHISPKTVETYRGRMKRKLGIKRTSELTRRATLWVEQQRLPDEEA